MELKNLVVNLTDDAKITEVLTVATNFPIRERVGVIGGVEQVVGYERTFGFGNGMATTIRFPKIVDSEPKTKDIFNFFGSITSGDKFRVIYKSTVKAKEKAETTPSGNKTGNFVAKGYYSSAVVIASTFEKADYRSNYLEQELPDFQISENIKVEAAWDKKTAKTDDISEKVDEEIPF